MSWQRFAKTLFKMEDADPGYMMLARANIPTEQKQRFMTGWVTFYNPGIAAAASEKEGAAFWQYLLDNYKTAKRASERRHFRGAQGMTALNGWRRQFKDPALMTTWMQGKDYFEVARQGKAVARVGAYFVWKYADVQERVFRIPCHFPPEAAKYSPKVPQQGAKLIDPKATVLETYDMIADYLNGLGYKSPPWYDRPLNMQEAETVCCVFKQYKHGKWAPGTRTAKATNSLLATPSDTAEIMLKALHSHSGVSRHKMLQWATDTLDQL